MTTVLLVSAFGFDVEIKRYGTAVEVDGFVQNGSVETIETKMSIQPLNGKELIDRQDLRRERSYYKAYSPVELKVSNQTNRTNADLVVWDGVEYEVQEVEYWTSPGLGGVSSYWKALLAEKNVNV